MPVFKFSAMNADGSLVEGSQLANSQEAAFQKIRERGLYPVKINEATTASRRRRGSKISKRDQAKFVRQLATLVGAGVSLLDAMDSLRRSGRNVLLAERAEAMAQQLRQGERLSVSLKKSFPDLPEYVFSLADLGESTGQLGQTLSDAADRMSADQKLASDIRSALTYPAILAAVGGLIIVGMFIFVIPRFGDLVERADADIPLVSRWVIDSGLWMRSYWYIFLGGLVATVFLVRLAIRASRETFSRFLYKVPAVGPILLKADFERWSRTLGVALSNGAELLQALDLAARSVLSPSLRAQLESLRRDVRQGASVDEAFETNVLTADPLLIDLMSTGGKSGALPAMLTLAADNFKQDIETLTKRVTAIAEPAAILLLSLIVGGLVVAVVLAMTSIYQVDVV